MTVFILIALLPLVWGMSWLVLFDMTRAFWRDFGWVMRLFWIYLVAMLLSCAVALTLLTVLGALGIVK